MVVYLKLEDLHRHSGQEDALQILGVVSLLHQAGGDETHVPVDMYGILMAKHLHSEQGYPGSIPSSAEYFQSFLFLFSQCLERMLSSEGITTTKHMLSLKKHFSIFLPIFRHYPM